MLICVSTYFLVHGLMIKLCSILIISSVFHFYIYIIIKLIYEMFDPFFPLSNVCLYFYSYSKLNDEMVLFILTPILIISSYLNLRNIGFIFLSFLPPNNFSALFLLHLVLTVKRDRIDFMF